MAESSFSVTVKKAAYIQKENPSSHVTAVAGTAYNVMGTRSTTKDNELLLVLNAAPDNLKRKRLLRMRLTMYLKRSNNSSLVGNCRIYPINDYSWNIDTVTYNTRPNLMTGREQYVFLHGDSQWIELTAPTESSSYDELYTGTAFHGGLCISAESTNNDSDDTKNWYARTDLANGTPAKLTAYYDTDVTVKSKASLVSPLNEAALSSLAASDFTWQFSKSGSYYCADERWRQSSATLYWKASDESSWHQINVSNARETEYTVTYYYTYTVPAYTFPCGKTISWYIVGTDRDGTTSTSATRTFTTNAATLSMTAYPNGSGVDNRLAQNFAWSITEDGTSAAVAQASARIYWKVSTASSYNHIDVSGNTKSKSVAGYTFTSGSTINWYLEATLQSGQVLSTSVASFSTAASKITALTYPSGNNVFSGAAISFTWELQSAVGNYTQRSAKLYWRSDSTQPYQSISASGSTKSLSVPANTFPTSATVNWYLEGVDASGYTSTSNEQSFSTQSTQITPQNSPTSGYSNPRVPITFQWYFAAEGGSIPQASAKLYWKVSSGSTYTEVSASGSTQSITIPANTFPVATTIDWYISGIDVGGTSSTSDVYTFSTTAARVFAIVKSPINSGVDGSAPITFKWTFRTADGYPPSRVILQWKLPIEDEQHWHDIIDTTDPITEYTVDADTFQSGETNWRVMAYNVDGILSSPTTASFICIIAPEITSVSATAVPFSTVSWQAAEQEAFQIEIDGTLYGPYFGAEKNYTLPEYLSDGVHTIGVRVLGRVDIWSNWAYTSVSVQNIPEGEITLQVLADTDVELNWEADSTETDFLIYRDGVLIGHTNRNSFTDRLTLGWHDYRVINRLESGNFDFSETVSRKTCVDYLYFESPDGTTAVNVNHSLKESSDPSYGNEREVYFNKYTGHVLPVATLSEFITSTVNCSVVFLYTEEEAHQKFVRLLGNVVIVKSSDGECYVAVISSWNKTAKKTYYTAYNLTLQKIDWGDYVDDAQ